MPRFQTAFASGRQPLPYDDASSVIALRADFAVSSAMVDALGIVRANFVANDVIEMFDLPDGHVIDDLVLVSDDIDSNGSPVAAISVGFINATDNGLDVSAINGGAALIASTAVGAGAVIARPTTAATWRVQPSGFVLSNPETQNRRRVGILVNVAPATVAAGTISLVARLRAARYGA